ncbi:MAG: hypothetical protein Q9227_006715 [Pyrenula ochraceoflavens]
MEGCSCWNEAPPGDTFFSSINDFNTAQQMLLSLRDLPDPPPMPSDGTDGPPDAQCARRKRDDDITMDVGFFAGLAEAACLFEIGDPFPSFDKKLTNADSPWEADSPSSTSMATSGSLSMDCGTASYSVSSAAPSPSSTPTSTPTYTGPATCESAGWKGSQSQIMLASRPWCASFGDGKTFDDPNQLGGCTAPLPNPDTAAEGQTGNVNDPPLGSLVVLFIRQDPAPQCSSVPLSSISFTNEDCWNAIKTAAPACPVPGDDQDTPGGNMGINCALYGYYAADSTQKGVDCPS